MVTGHQFVGQAAGAMELFGSWKFKVILWLVGMTAWRGDGPRAGGASLSGTAAAAGRSMHGPFQLTFRLQRIQLPVMLRAYVCM